MVDTIRLPATARADFGKGYARRIRANDQIPAHVEGEVAADAVETLVAYGLPEVEQRCHSR